MRFSIVSRDLFWFLKPEFACSSHFWQDAKLSGSCLDEREVFEFIVCGDPKQKRCYCIAHFASYLKNFGNENSQTLRVHHHLAVAQNYRPLTNTN